MYEFLGMEFMSIGQMIGFFGVILISIAGLFWIILGWRREIIKQRKQYENMDKPQKLVDVEAYSVTVVDKFIDTISYGYYKFPKTRTAFFVTFELENGMKRSYEVDERYFRRIKKGSTGELAVADGKFIGFSKGR